MKPFLWQSKLDQLTCIINYTNHPYSENLKMFGQRRVEADVRVSRILDRLGIRYQVDEDGDYRVVFELSNGRTQQAFIDSKTQQLGSYEIRDVWSVGYSCEGFLDQEIANYLLIENANKKIGAWELRPLADNRYIAVFCTKVAADCDPEALYTSIRVVLEVADELEKVLEAGDRF
ncbi:hypothetical protein RHP47_00485 [Thermosynechococcus sp. QKsg1]|uniref:hypothetical protein n=1 Tax=unclassified Thermosynechococcus TaxID=2622553 RepID=UPI002576F4F6|nr:MULTISPECIES: hypothetical protein [unclassified Thermosynechococcus]WJI24189.1 hypothetical protein MZ909_00505 [Thermosynechococcus sp. B0]WKT83824.1 hypothetical protein QYC28_00490 [Thermosynechococcus sp. HY596]WNC62955.1 hypothetical protein RHK13_00490 [Thermosynechococcus sp. HY591]WNC65514.1 hypothetical protein RHK28_00490 [Thermosynechococcus sp. HY593]WNC86822.1 hypothetical protein RHP47_00485 [Thermosynechococcus sp. QKsg1]